MVETSVGTVSPPTWGAASPDWRLPGHQWPSGWCPSASRSCDRRTDRPLCGWTPRSWSRGWPCRPATRWGEVGPGPPHSRPAWERRGRVAVRRKVLNSQFFFFFRSSQWIWVLLPKKKNHKVKYKTLGQCLLDRIWANMFHVSEMLYLELLLGFKLRGVQATLRSIVCLSGMFNSVTCIINCRPSWFPQVINTAFPFRPRGN